MARDKVDRELDTEEWKQILDKSWQAGIPHVIFTGGEPTRRKDLIELVEYAEKLGQVTGVLTDGCRLSNREYVESLSQAGLDHFLIVYSPDDADCLQGIKNALASDIFTALHITIIEESGDKPKEWLTQFNENAWQNFVNMSLIWPWISSGISQSPTLKAIRSVWKLQTLHLGQDERGCTSSRMATSCPVRVLTTSSATSLSILGRRFGPKLRKYNSTLNQLRMECPFVIFIFAICSKLPGPS